jgi:hypothetical protein
MYAVIKSMRLLRMLKPSNAMAMWDLTQKNGWVDRLSAKACLLNSRTISPMRVDKPSQSVGSHLIQDHTWIQFGASKLGDTNKTFA